MSTDVLRKRALTIREILAWAEEHHAAAGKWPTKDCGPIIGTIGETWLAVDGALRAGTRGLSGGSSLAQLLAKTRGVRNIHGLSPLSEEQILAWADAHHQRTGTWPTAKSGPVHAMRDERWRFINTALRVGSRTLPGGSSLARLLAKHRGVRNRKGRPPFTEEQILAWADAHRERTGNWPSSSSGPVLDLADDTWLAVDVALRKGLRHLPGGKSLALLLAQRRGVRNNWTRPDFTLEQILAWADAYHARAGKWPNLKSGPIQEAPAETWCAVDKALRNGRRGVPGDLSLAKLLAAERGVRNQVNVPPLTRKRILAWADAHYRRTGRWPNQESGPIAEAPEETWAAVDAALKDGTRRLRGGSSLARFLARHRGKRNHADLPRLSKKKILAWADAHHERTGAWPNVNSGPVFEAPEERWRLIDQALRMGHRKLTGGSSLAQLLARKRGVRNPACLPPLTEEQIRHWAILHHQRTGCWPQDKSGPIADVPGETWRNVDYALRQARRGLTTRSSLAQLLAPLKAEAEGGRP